MLVDEECHLPLHAPSWSIWLMKLILTNFYQFEDFSGYGLKSKSTVVNLPQVNSPTKICKKIAVHTVLYGMVNFH
jgi:hypothetical protein